MIHQALITLVQIIEEMEVSKKKKSNFLPLQVELVQLSKAIVKIIQELKKGHKVQITITLPTFLI